MDELDKILNSTLKEDVELPKSYHNTIQNTLYKEQKNYTRKNSIIKIILAITSSAILTTGVAFAVGVPKYIARFFNNNKGLDIAVENNYILNTNMEYINSDKLQIKVDNMLMDDFNLSMTFSIKFNEEVDINNIEKINFNDMIITDENKRIIYCEDKEIFYNYCKKNNLNHKYLEFNENYINNGMNYYIKSKDDNTLVIVYNLYANKYPKSKHLYIDLSKIDIIENNNTSTLKGNWNISIDIPEKFYNRQACIYTVKKCSDSRINVKEFAVYDTCAKFEFDLKVQPVFDETEPEEVKRRKKDEFIEWSMNDTHTIIENEYIESETKEKYYPTRK